MLSKHFYNDEMSTLDEKIIHSCERKSDKCSASQENKKFVRVVVKVNRQQPTSVRLRLIQKIPTLTKWLISPLPELINQICKKYNLKNPYHYTINQKM